MKTNAVLKITAVVLFAAAIIIQLFAGAIVAEFLPDGSHRVFGTELSDGQGEVFITVDGSTLDEDYTTFTEKFSQVCAVYGVSGRFYGLSVTGKVHIYAMTIYINDTSGEPIMYGYYKLENGRMVIDVRNWYQYVDGAPDSIELRNNNSI